MNQRQKDCILEVQELLLSINETVKKYDLQNEFLSVIAVGFLDMSTTFRDDDGNERADMNLLSTFTVSDEDELDDMLSYCVEAYRADSEEEAPEEGTIDWWLKNFGNGTSLN
jgi:hypothetical protein|tara:strand:+ start:2499 stop:2834 length:336 start_codon:yes stop_codon:yes gene_type:complete